MQPFKYTQKAYHSLRVQFRGTEQIKVKVKMRSYKDVKEMTMDREKWGKLHRREYIADQ